VKAMPNEMESGKAFEYALTVKLLDRIKQNYNVEIIKDLTCVVCSTTPCKSSVLK